MPSRILDVWIVDSGATSHMCANPDYFVSIDKTVKQEVFLADGRKKATEGVGSCKLVWESPEGIRVDVVLSDVLYVPKFETNLISVKKLTACQVKVDFDADGYRILKDEKVIGTAAMVDGLYKLRTVHEAQRVLATRVKTHNIGRKVMKQAKMEAKLKKRDFEAAVPNEEDDEDNVDDTMLPDVNVSITPETAEGQEEISSGQNMHRVIRYRGKLS